MNFKNILKEEIIEGKSIFVAVMNRTLEIESWLKTTCNEIIILDWSSTQPLNIPKSDKIKYFRVNDKKYWILTIAFNIASRLTRYSNILKVDADTILPQNFFENHELTDENFYAGNWRIATDENSKHLNGIMYCKRNNFFKVHGYNEYLQTYGWDDCDLYNRLSFLKRENIKSVQHRPHDNKLRTLNSFDHTEISVSIDRNCLLANEIKWNGPMLPLIIKDNICIIPNVVPTPWKEIIERLTDQASKNKQRFKLFLEVNNGLGNRLRSLASAANISIASKRDFTLVWIINNHCRADFKDLFDLDFIKYYFFLNGIKFIVSNRTQPVGKIYSYKKEDRPYIDDSIKDDIYIYSSCVLNNKLTSWTLEHSFLCTLRPVKSINDKIKDYSVKLDITNCIGVHIRMGQIEKEYEQTNGWYESSKNSLEEWREKSHWNIFLKEMLKLLSENLVEKFFLCYDNDFIKNEIIKFLPKSTVYIEREIFDRDKEDIELALIEMILLSKTKYILGSNWSSFTEVAQKIGNLKCKLASVHF
jgi:hypothetical protein